MPKEQTKLAWGQFSTSIGPRIRVLRNQLASRSINALEPYSLPSGALSMMVLIAANDGCSQTELAVQTGMNKSAVVGILDELEKRGLAQRDRSAHDRRRNSLSLTTAGAVLAEEMQLVAIAQEAPIRAALSPEELEVFLKLLDQVSDALDLDNTKPD